MKIEAKKNEQLNFNNLALGTPIWHYIDLWIKISTVLNTDGNVVSNAVNLKSGLQGLFNATTPITIAKVKIVNNED